VLRTEGFLEPGRLGPSETSQKHHRSEIEALLEDRKDPEGGKGIEGLPDPGIAVQRPSEGKNVVLWGRGNERVPQGSFEFCSTLVSEVNRLSLRASPFFWNSY
jgi:hypothetical protein